jgi:peptide/nickel transport system permease protein
VAAVDHTIVGWRRTRARHPLAAFLAKRVLAGVATLVVASILIFFATQVLPGNVATIVLGKNANPQAVERVSDRLDLDESLPQRYLDWAGGVLHGDLGDSAVAIAQGADSAPIGHLIAKPLRNSVILAGITALLLIPLSLALGVLAALRAGRPTDHAITATTLVLGALPEFVVGALLIAIFFSLLGLLPGVDLIGPGETPFSHPDALVLPVITLLAVTLASAVRQIRNGVIEVLGQEYVAFARLNALPRRRVLWRYVIRNALAPSVQILAQNIQYLVGGIIIVEGVFAYPGIGQFFVNAVQTRDVPEVEAVAVILAAVYILINIIADTIVVLLVPKLRTSLS